MQQDSTSAAEKWLEAEPSKLKVQITATPNFPVALLPSPKMKQKMEVVQGAAGCCQHRAPPSDLQEATQAC